MRGKIDPRVEFAAKAQACDEALTIVATVLRHVDASLAGQCERVHREQLNQLKTQMAEDFSAEGAFSMLMGAAFNYFCIAGDILEQGEAAFAGQSVMAKNVHYTTARAYMSATTKMLRHAMLSLASITSGKPN